jgi:ubiquitin-like-conjugating enzyme ATG3
MITYDKYYQTPRIWLLGYDEVSERVRIQITNLVDPAQNGTPLVNGQIFQDVTTEHAFKTVTIEAFPHSSSLQAASVHPCKHASVMRKLIERMNAGVVEEQKSQQRKGSSKDGKKKWLFKRGGGSGKDDRPAGEEEEVEGLRVDFYLVVFLKFIASIVPTIEVDSTTAF